MPDLDLDSGQDLESVEVLEIAVAELVYLLNSLVAWRAVAVVEKVVSVEVLLVVLYMGVDMEVLLVVDP